MNFEKTDATISQICVDASFVVRLVVEAPGSEQADALWRKWTEQKREVVAPSLLYPEITNALYGYQKANWLSADTIRSCHEAVLAFDIVLFSERVISRRALALATELQLRAAYDAHYLALAEMTGAELWTADGRFVRNLAGRFPRVHLLEP